MGCALVTAESVWPLAKVQAKTRAAATHPAADATATTFASGTAAWLASQLPISRRRDAGLGSGAAQAVPPSLPVGVGYRGRPIGSESWSGWSAACVGCSPLMRRDVSTKSVRIDRLRCPIGQHAVRTGRSSCLGQRPRTHVRATQDSSWPARRHYPGTSSADRRRPPGDSRAARAGRPHLHQSCRPAAPPQHLPEPY
jgi:hypothetical protein